MRLGLIYSLIPGLQDPGSFWMRLTTRSVEEAFARSGGTILSRNLWENEEFPEPIGKALESLLHQGVGGIVVVGINDILDPAEEIISSVDTERTPVVYTSWHAVRPPLAHVYNDSDFEGYQAAQHLISRGYRNIVFIKPYEAHWVNGRIEWAHQAVRESRLDNATFSVYPPATRSSSNTAEYQQLGYEAMRETLEAGIEKSTRGTAPLGVIAPNDYTAFGVMKAISEAGLTLGQDVGLVGFDDDPLSGSLGLTTVRRPFEALGHASADMLLREMSGDRSHVQVRLRSLLIPRISTQPISQNLNFNGM